MDNLSMSFLGVKKCEYLFLINRFLIKNNECMWIIREFIWFGYSKSYNARLTLQNVSANKRHWLRLMFCLWKWANPSKYLTDMCSLCSNPWLVSIVSRNGLATIWRQAISWSNDDKNLCCLEGTSDVYALRNGPTRTSQNIFSSPSRLTFSLLVHVSS